MQIIWTRKPKNRAFRTLYAIDYMIALTYYAILNLYVYYYRDNMKTEKLTAVKYLIFDLDGTLIDSSRGVAKATNYALEKMGERTRSLEEIAAFIGFPLEDMFHAFSNGSYDDFWTHFQEKGETVIAASARPIGNADRILRSLKDKGYRIGIGTTKRRVHVTGILHNLGWDNLIEAYVGADDVVNVKPAPDSFIETMNRLGARIENSLVVGDTVNDVLAAKKSGIPVAAVKSIFGREKELVDSGPDYLLGSLDELLDLLE